MALQPLCPADLGVHTERLGPLPLINHFVARMGLMELLERHVPTTDGRSTLSHAQALGVLLRSIVVEREPVYRQQETATGFAAGLFRVDAAQAARLSDDRIGRALDRLFDADRAALLTGVVLAVAQRFALGLQQFTTIRPRSRCAASTPMPAGAAFVHAAPRRSPMATPKTTARI